MEESKKKWNDQEKNKLVIKMGGGGGGGIGAVVLLGGVLATAALASAFVVRRKGRRSDKDPRRRHQNSINKHSEQDEGRKGEEFVSNDQPSHVNEHQSKGAKEQFENDTAFVVSNESLTLDEKARIETNGDQTLYPISPRKLEKDAVSDDGFVVVDEDFPSSPEKLPLESKNKMSEDAKTKVQEIDDHSKESKNLEQVYIEEERAERELNDDGEIGAICYKEAVDVTEMQSRQEENTQICNDQENVEVTEVDYTVAGVQVMEAEKNAWEGFSCGNGEISEAKCVEVVERAKVDSSGDAIGGNQEANGNDSCLSEVIVSESHSEDGEKTLEPVFDSLVIEHENVDGDEKEGVLLTENVEVVHEDQVRYIEEKLVKEQEKCDQSDEGNVTEKSEEVEWIDEAKRSDRLSGLVEEKEDKIFIPSENEEENGCIVHSTPENVMPLLEELTSPEVMKEDRAKDDVVEGLEAYENKSMMQFDAKENIEKGIVEEVISPEDVKFTKEDGAYEGIPESLELKEDVTVMQFPNSQPKDGKDDLERDTEKEVEEEMISHENIKAIKDDIVNEDVAGGAEESEKEHEEEVQDSSETINTVLATETDGLVMEMSDDEEKGADKIKDFNDEATSSDEVDESSVETSDSSTDSNSDAVWPVEPQQVKLITFEVERKIQEHKTIEESEDKSQIIDEKASFESYQVKAEEKISKKSSENFSTEADEKGNAEKIFANKYVVDLGMLRDNRANPTRRRMVIALSVLSSLSCSWYFGLSYVKLCLVVFLAMFLSEIHSY